MCDGASLTIRRCACSSLDTPGLGLRQYEAVAPDSSTSTPQKLGIELGRLSWARRLGLDYVHNFDALAPFYAGNPADASAWRAAVDRAQRHPRDRQTLVALLTAQQRSRQAPPAALASTARLADPQAVAIVTGQQAGLFGGPVYTVLKALTAIKLARRIEAEQHVPVVPVFWIDAEDHDWNEISGCSILDADLELRTVRMPGPEGAGERPVARVRLDDRITAVIEELRTTFPPTEFTEPLIEQLRGFYAPGTGMVEAFGRWIDALLGPLGLVVFDCSDPAAKPLVRDIFLREIETAGRTATLALEAGRAMEARGYTAQVEPADDSVALFHLDGRREAIKRSGDGFVIGDRTVSASDLAAEARATPDHFSPNVLLRPLVQDTLFPTVAYVGGPSELGYLGQLRGVYEHFGLPMPLIYPRATATVLDSAGTRFLTKYELPLETLQPQDEATLNRLLESLLPPQLEASLDRAETVVVESMQAVTAQLTRLDPTLEGAAKSTLGKMSHELASLRNKLIQAAKRRDETLRRQFVRARAQAFPDGQPQERTIGFISLQDRYGPALVELLEHALPLDLGVHWVITL